MSSTATGSDPAPKHRRFLANLRFDVQASFVVFLVALPLSLGIAIASGAPQVAAGLIAAVVGGIVAGALGGSAVQVSGPAAGLTVVVAELIEDLGFEMLCVMTIAAGALQILFGVSRMARAALAIAPVVVHAMLAGIGITIVLQQFHVLIGHRTGNLADGLIDPAVSAKAERIKIARLLVIFSCLFVSPHSQLATPDAIMQRCVLIVDLGCGLVMLDRFTVCTRQLGLYTFVVQILPA